MPSAQSLEKDPENRPLIGVFDSGIGGLTVVRSLLQSLPPARYLYLGDIARLPYGTKSPETIRSYLIQCLEFLSAQKVDALVVACNSASTQLQENEWRGIPIFNVIDPAAEMAAQISLSGKILLLATRATVASQVYDHKIRNLRPTAKLTSVACPLFVPLAEEGLWEDKLTNLIAFRYLGHLVSPLDRVGFSEQPSLDTAILGCTHYPLLRTAIEKALGPQCRLIESGEPLAKKMFAALAPSFWSKSLENKIKNLALKPHEGLETSKAKGPLDIFLTDQPDSLIGLIPKILGSTPVRLHKAKL